jgi:hypothetical protein
MTTTNKIELSILVWAILTLALAALYHWVKVRAEKEANEFEARCTETALRCTCRFMGGFDVRCPSHGIPSDVINGDNGVLLSGSDWRIFTDKAADGTEIAAFRKIPPRPTQTKTI